MSDVTILIPTYKGRALLTRLLAALEAARPASGLEWDVLVVDNNSPDDTRGLVEAFRAARLPTLRYVFESRPGKCYALNRGLMETSARFVAFLDHDAVPTDGYLVGLRDALQSRPYNVFGGRVIPRFSGPLPRWVTGERPLQTSRGGIIAHDYGDTPRPYDDEMRLPIGCNFVCRRSLFDVVGPFNVDLGPRPGAQFSGEESDILRRLRANGERILYCPAITVVHPVEAERVTKRYFRYRLFCSGRTVVRASIDQPAPVRLFGIPRYLYGQFLAHAAKMLVAAVRGDSYGTFDHELDIWYTLGIAYESTRIARRGLSEQPLW